MRHCLTTVGRLAALVAVPDEQRPLAADRLQHAIARRHVELRIRRAVHRVETLRRAIGVGHREMVQHLGLPASARRAVGRGQMRDDRLAQRHAIDDVRIRPGLLVRCEPLLESRSAHVGPHAIERRRTAQPLDVRVPKQPGDVGRRIVQLLFGDRRQVRHQDIANHRLIEHERDGRATQEDMPALGHERLGDLAQAAQMAGPGEQGPKRRQRVRALSGGHGVLAMPIILPIASSSPRPHRASGGATRSF
jgi:hypothetical protein